MNHYESTKFLPGNSCICNFNALPIMKQIFLFYLLNCIAFSAQSQFKPDQVALHFLNDLKPMQMDQVQFKLTDSTKTRWHYLPHSSFQRSGLSMDSLSVVQNKNLMDLLDAFLSNSGYDKMEQIIDLENYLAIKEQNPTKRNPKKYYVAFYGTPNNESPWAWSFEGHHLSFNFTVHKDQVAIAPAFLGSNPGVVLEGPQKGKRVLHREQDLGLQLINSMSAQQSQKAIISEVTFGDVLSKNKSFISRLEESGIRYTALTAAQKGIVNAIIKEHMSNMEPAVAHRAKILLENENYDDITFCWAGKKEILTAHYYRIQGEKFLIEFDNSQNKGNHIHTVWREYIGDFGKDLIEEHYLNSDHH